MGWRVGKGSHENDPSVSEQTQSIARTQRMPGLCSAHRLSWKRILSQQTASSEDMLPACSFSTTPVILAKIFLPRFLYCIYGKISLLTNAIHHHQKEYVLNLQAPVAEPFIKLLFVTKRENYLFLVSCTSFALYISPSLFQALIQSKEYGFTHYCLHWLTQKYVVGKILEFLSFSKS